MLNSNDDLVDGSEPQNIAEALAGGYSVCGIDVDDEYNDSISFMLYGDLNVVAGSQQEND